MLNLADLHQFTGTEHWYRHGLVRSVLYTDGVKYMADKAGAYWLLDKIATLQLEPAVVKESFQAWRLSVTGDAATLVCEDGNDNVIHREQITYTDFPEPGVTVWVEDNVILLPSEH